MRSPLERVDESVIIQCVSDGWGLGLDEFRYFPEGGGAYHWHATTADGRRWFVTCDDLDTKPWLGVDRGAVFDGLTIAYGAAVDLHASGLSFVVAPLGPSAVRIDDRHSVSVFAHVDGEPQEWGHQPDAAALDELVTTLVRLHGAATPGELFHRDLRVPWRDDLEAALGDLEHPWDAGPLSDAARVELARHADLLERWLAHLDRANAAIPVRDVVVTHGEPHPGNLIHTSSGFALVDWDTIALAPRERDLWMLADVDADLIAAYEGRAGVTVDRDVLSAYRLLWAATDVAGCTAQLRTEHKRDADAERALDALRSIFAGAEPAPFGFYARGADVND